MAALGIGGLAFTAIGFLAAIYTTLPPSLLGFSFLSDEASRSAYIPPNEEAQTIEEYINAHPLTRKLRDTPGMVESRPHVKMPNVFKQQSLTAGSLTGPGKLVVPPYAWKDTRGKSLVSIAYIGKNMCGHPELVHGGLLATLLDEGLASCCFAALPHQIGVTAKLEINYRKPAQANSYFVLLANTVKVEGRKAWVEGRIETLPRDGEAPVTIAEASALFVSPKHAWVSGFKRPKNTNPN